MSFPDTVKIPKSHAINLESLAYYCRQHVAGFAEAEKRGTARIEKFAHGVIINNYG